MKRWLLSGLPLAFLLAILAMGGVALSAFLSYRDIQSNLDSTLRERIQGVAQEVVEIAVRTANASPGELWNEEERDGEHRALRPA